MMSYEGAYESNSMLAFILAKIYRLRLHRILCLKKFMKPTTELTEKSSNQSTRLERKSSTELTSHPKILKPKT